MDLSDEEWKERLTPEQYKVLRQKGTETPFSGEFVLPQKNGMYACQGCGTVLFSASSQYESKTPGLIGWPSFSDVIASDTVRLQDDNSLGMHRTEVVCATCGGHLGHLFEDADAPNGKHYCINSCALDFKSDTSE
jgi:peptide-methionine (R)-S-oxide reductase